MTTFEFTFNETFFIQAIRRNRQCRMANKYAVPLKSLIAAILLAVAVLAARQHLYGVAAMLVVLVVLISLGRYDDEGPMRRRFRRHRQYNQRVTIELLEHEVRSSSDQIKKQALWTFFTKARRFEDGFLLFEGPTLIHWLPISSIVSGSEGDAHHLIASHVTDYSQV